jgi:calcineurin-like phosphoesterase family protein
MTNTHNIFLIADTHFDHNNILSFKRDDGSPLRTFNSCQEMNETMIQNWNKVVKTTDTVWHLGDLGFGEHMFTYILPRLNGQNNLLLGNHDKSPIVMYQKHFKKIHACAKLGKLLLTHYPIARSSIEFSVKANIHGHIHDKIVHQQDGSPDPLYLNVGVERISYTPISIEDVRNIVGKNLGEPV